MKLTAKMKQWLIENMEVAEDATDDDFAKALGSALAAGTLTSEKFTELQKAEAKTSAAEQKLDAMLDGITKLGEILQQQRHSEETKTTETKEEETVSETKETSTKSEKPDWYSSLTKRLSESHGDDGSDVRVKGAWERYDTTKTALKYPETTKRGQAHPKAGRPVKWFDHDSSTLDEPSEQDRAVAGAWAKFLVNAARHKSKSLGFAKLPDHDRDLILFAMDQMKWGGSLDGGPFADINNRKLTPFEQKALIDDATSGGIEAAPIVFDDQVIQTPLLYGELFPLVTVRPLDRGRRVEGVETATVTGSWGGIDDTAISLFDTTSYVSAFDTTIYRWEGAIQIGLDFLSDTPIDFGAHITAQYGERLLEDLDDVIAVGNGTTQPEGVMNKVGAASITFGGSMSLGNLESLRFGVAKAEHRPNLVGSAVFIGNETSYQRAHALPVGGTDARRLFGMDYDAYRIMNHDFRINESMANTQMAYAILARYRMYQRRGLTLRTSTEGDTLIRQNEMLIVATARFGGQLERGACAAVTTTAPA